MGPSNWKPGKYYVDEQEFNIPASVRTGKIQITTGVWKKAARLKILKGPADRSNRGLVATIKLTGAKAKPKPPVNTRVPEMTVMKLDEGETIKIDGKTDEAAWKKSATTGKLRDVQTGAPNKKFPVNGAARLLWDDKNLYVAFDVQDTNVVGGFKKTEKDPHLWTRDTVELMIDPDGDGDNKDYYEIQINPQNLVFDSQFDSYNQPKKGPKGPFGHQNWSAKLKSAVVINGTLDKPDDKDTGYVVEAAIPWTSFSKAKQTPPKPGARWRMNFYAMQNNGGVAWSPILGQGNFHKASRFGRVTFADKDYKPPPKSRPSVKSLNPAAISATKSGVNIVTKKRKPLKGVEKP